MVNWLKKIILSKYIKGFLDKLPLDGYKTYIGLLLLILGAAVQFYGESSVTGAALKAVIDVLKTVNGVIPIEDAGVIALVVGLVHKILKQLSKLAS